MTFLNKMYKFLKTDFKLHPANFLEADEQEHTTVDQRKENQRTARALRRLYPTFDLIWHAQMELATALKETTYMESSVFNEHGLEEYFKDAKIVAEKHDVLVKLIKKHSNETLIKNYYEQFQEYMVDLFPHVFDGKIQQLMADRAGISVDDILVCKSDLIKLYKDGK